MNKIILLGRLTRDPEIKYTSGVNPMAVAKYTLAVDRRFKRDGEPTTDFFNCTSFGKQAEVVQKYLTKGKQASIVGHIQFRQYEGKDGIKRQAMDVLVDELYFVGSKNDGGNQNAATGAPTGGSSGGFYPVGDIDDDDLPF